MAARATRTIEALAHIVLLNRYIFAVINKCELSLFSTRIRWRDIWHHSRLLDIPRPWPEPTGVTPAHAMHSAALSITDQDRFGASNILTPSYDAGAAPSTHVNQDLCR